MDKGTAADIEMLEEALAGMVAPWVRALGLRVAEAHAGQVLLRLPVTPSLVHGGGVLCGQALMAAADTAMVLAVMTRLGGFKPMTTVQLQTSFLRPIPGKPAGGPAGDGDGDGPPAEARVIARVLRLGKSLVFGEIEVQDPAGRLAAHATTTYALL